LGDDPGVGKTPPTIVAIASLGFPDTLIVCPKNAIGVWEAHLEEWYGHKAKLYISGRAKYADIASPGVLITNYEQLGDIVKRRQYWSVVVLDEAHKIRNRKTQAFTNTKRISAKYFFLLSGTPVFKGAQDLWAPLNVLAPMKFTAYWPFVGRYCFEDVGWGGSRNVWGVKDPLQLAKDLSPYFLRRRKVDVLTDLPVKQRDKIPLHMTPKQAKHYVDLVREMMTETSEGLVLTPSAAVRTVRLRELLVSPRLLAIDDDGVAVPALMEKLEERGTPTLVYTPFRAGVRVIAEYIRRNKWAALELVGGLTPSRTAAIVREFQNGTDPNRVLVATVSIGSAWTGTAAQQTYFVGYDWAPQINIQAEDRMHRYGGRGYEVYYFTHRGTIDEHVMDVLGGKITVENLIVNHRLILDTGRI